MDAGKLPMLNYSAARYLYCACVGRCSHCKMWGLKAILVKIQVLSYPETRCLRQVGNHQANDTASRLRTPEHDCYKQSSETNRYLMTHAHFLLVQHLLLSQEWLCSVGLRSDQLKIIDLLSNTMNSNTCVCNMRCSWTKSLLLNLLCCTF